MQSKGLKFKRIKSLEKLKNKMVKNLLGMKHTLQVKKFKTNKIKFGVCRHQSSEI